MIADQVLSSLNSRKRSTCTIFFDKLILHTRHLYKHNQAGRKEKPGRSDDGQEVGDEQELDSVPEVDGG
jgi:hypothetical protein